MCCILIRPEASDDVNMRKGFQDVNLLLNKLEFLFPLGTSQINLLAYKRLGRLLWYSDFLYCAYCTLAQVSAYVERIIVRRPKDAMDVAPKA